MRKYPSQKNKIIQAAEQLIIEQGPGSLKTDAIIAASGLSKGGFFYHFKTLDDLLYEVAVKNWKDFLDLVQQESKKDKNPVGRFCRAYLKVSLGAVSLSKQRKNIFTLNNIFLEVALTNHRVMDRLKKEEAQMVDLFEKLAKNDGLTQAVVHVIQMAADGIWFNQTVGYVGLKKKDKENLYKYLEKLTHQ